MSTRKLDYMIFECEETANYYVSAKNDSEKPPVLYEGRSYDEACESIIKDLGYQTQLAVIDQKGDVVTMQKLDPLEDSGSLMLNYESLFKELDLMVSCKARDMDSGTYVPTPKDFTQS